MGNPKNIKAEINKKLRGNKFGQERRRRVRSQSLGGRHCFTPNTGPTIEQFLPTIEFFTYNSSVLPTFDLKRFYPHNWYVYPPQLKRGTSAQ